MKRSAILMMVTAILAGCGRNDTSSPTRTASTEEQWAPITVDQFVADTGDYASSLGTGENDYPGAANVFVTTSNGVKYKVSIEANAIKAAWKEAGVE